MSNKFIKISSENIKIAQPTGSGTPSGTTGASGTVPPPPISGRSRTQERFDESINRSNRSRITQDRPKLVDPSSSPMTAFVEKVMKFSDLSGSAFERLKALLLRRSDIIDQMLGQLDEDLVAKYFDEFLFKKKIPEDVTLDLMQRALDCSKTSSSLEDALDFALVHYDQKRNLNRTINIMDLVKDTQSIIPIVRLFSLLKDAVSGKPVTLSFLDLGPKFRSQAPLINRLISLSISKPEEDMTVFIRDIQKRQDAVKREIQINDRMRGIIDGFLTDETNRALDRNVKLVREILGESVKSDILMNFRRMLYQLKLGRELRNEFFADLEKVERAPEAFPSKSTQTITSSYKFVRIAQNVDQSNPEQKVQEVLLDDNKKTLLNSFIDRLINDAVKIVQKSDQKNNTEKKPEISRINSDFNNFIRALTTIKANLQAGMTNKQFNEAFYKALDSLKTTPGANLVKEASTQNDRRIATAQIDLSRWNEFFNVGSQVASGVIGVGGLLKGDIVSIAGAYVFNLFKNYNEKQIQLSKVLGLSAPKQERDEATLRDAEARLKAILDLDDLRRFEQAEAYLESRNEQIANSEQNLSELVSVNLEVGGGDTQKYFFTDADKVAQAHRAHKELLEKTLQENILWRRQVEQLSEKYKSNVNYATFQSGVKAYLILMDKQVNQMRKKLAGFASLALIAKNVQQKKVLLTSLQKYLPKLQKWLGAGVSITDVMRHPGGLLDQLKAVLEQQRQALSIIFKDLQRLEAVKPSPKPIAQATELKSPEIGTTGTIQFESPFRKPVQPKSELATFTEANTRTNNLRFTNLIVEAQYIQTTPTDEFATETPQYGYYLSKVNDPNVQAENLIKAIRSDLKLQPEELAKLENLTRVKHYKEKIFKATTNDIKLINDYIMKESIPTRLSLEQRNELLTLLRKKLTPGDPLAIQIENEMRGSKTPSAFQTGANVGFAVGTGSTISPVTTSTTGSGTGTTIPSGTSASEPIGSMNEEVARSQKQLESTKNALSFFDNVLPTAEDALKNPEAYRQSLKFQAQELQASIDAIEGAYNQLLLNPPTDVGGVQGLYNLSHTNAKFIKTAEDKELEADQKNIDYVGDYYDELYDKSKGSPEFGEAIKHPEKWRKTRTVDIPEIK